MVAISKCALAESKIDPNVHRIKVIQTQLELVYIDCGFDRASDLNSGVLISPLKCFRGERIASVFLVDTFKLKYQVICPGAHLPKHCDTWSYGPDGINGAEDDIVNW